MLARAPGVTYDTLRDGFRWELPQRLNMGVLCADRHPAAARALIEQQADGSRREHTFGELARLSSRFANALLGLGIMPGDRVAIVLPQRVETGIAHLAIYKVGAVAVPLSGLFGPDALRYRLADSGSRLVITDEVHRDVVAEVAGELGGVGVVVVDGVRPGHEGFWELIQSAAEAFAPAETGPDTPALLIYTSGTTGSPKGALHGHRVLYGHLPGWELSHDFFPQEGDVVWTPADWAWIGGLMDALMPAWFHGRPVVSAAREKFDPEWARRLMIDHGVRNAFLPPTALKLMRQADSAEPAPELRSIMCGGEPLGDELLAWVRGRFGLEVNEIYGQTEANYVVGNSSRVWDVRPGSMGRAYPGHEIAILGEDGAPAPPGTLGQIAVGRDDPVMFLEYWGRPDATREKFTPDGEWLLTGDLATADEDGYLWFASRNDDIINSAGYRIGPAEIESCLMHHPAVAMAAAVGVPDPVRGEVVKAFIQVAEGHAPSADLEREIQQLVRTRLAAYVYPRQIEFVQELPLTTTGKIRRTELRKLEATRTGEQR